MSDEIKVVIEIPYMSNVKYELDEENNLHVDRVLNTSMYYPGNYGYIPNTLAEDGDAVDVLIINNTPFVPNSHIKCRVVGMLITEDEKGMDQKVLAVPNHKIENTFEQIKDIDDVNENMLNMIKNFYENYKSNEKGKWVKVSDFQSKEKTIEFIKKSTL